VEIIKIATRRAAIALCSGLIGIALFTAATGDDQPPVASFGTGPGDRVGADPSPRPPQDAAGDQPGSAAAAGDGPLMSFNFRFAPWPDVLKLFAETAGLTLDLTDTPPGTFNYFDTKKHTSTEALDVLNGYLLPRGFLLVRRDRFLVCLNVERGVPPNLVPKIRPEDLPARGDNELLTVVFDLGGGQAEQAAAEVQPLLGPHGQAVPLKASGSLLVTDTGRSLRLIDGLLQRSRLVPRPAASGTLVFRAYPLKHISAREGERLVREMFGLPDGGGAKAGGSSAPGRAAAAVRLTAESRTNSLLVTASSGDLEMIGQLLEAADVDAPPTGSSAGPNGFRTTVEVVPLGTADAARIGRALGLLTPRIRVSTSGESPVSAATPPPTKPADRPPKSANGTPAENPPANAEGARDNAANGR
jgi:hypothetical protein